MNQFGDIGMLDQTNDSKNYHPINKDLVDGFLHAIADLTKFSKLDHLAFEVLGNFLGS